MSQIPQGFLFQQNVLDSCWWVMLGLTFLFYNFGARSTFSFLLLSMWISSISTIQYLSVNFKFV